MAERGTITLGDRVRDGISGFVGIAVARTLWLNGCERVTVAPTELKDGAPIDNHTFDIEQIEVVQKAKVEAVRQTGGDRVAPTRAADPRR